MTPETITYAAIPHPLPARAAVRLAQLGQLAHATFREIEELLAANKDRLPALTRDLEALRSELTQFEADLRRVYAVSVTRPRFVSISPQPNQKEQHHAR